MGRRLAKGWVYLAADPRWKMFARRYAGDLPRFAREVCKMHLSEQQEQLMIETQAPRARVSVSSGHGCFGKGTLVMGANWEVMPVEAVQVGDYLMGADGCSARQVQQLKRGQQSMYKFTYMDGTHHVFNESHTLCLIEKSSGQRVLATVKQWLELGASWQVQHACQRLTKAATKEQQAKYELLEIARVDSLGEGDYYGFTLDGDQMFLGGDFTVLHNTGKTTSLAVIILWHMLVFPGSVTMLTANDMDQLKATLWKEVGLAVERIRTGVHGWLYQHIDLLSDGSMRVKGYEDTWFVESKTANAKTANKMAGRHGKYFLVIGDEASTLPDEVCTTLNNALTEANNRFVLSSQPTRSAGFFYDTHHSLSIYSGGVWVPLVFDSFDSPFVADVQLVEMWNTYDEDQRRVRLQGLFPQDSSKHFMNRKHAEAMYTRGRIIGDNEPWGWLALADIGGGEGQRDKSALVFVRVIGQGAMGDNPRRVEVVEIPIHTNRIRSNTVSNHIREESEQKSNVNNVIDAGSMGLNVCQDLEDAGLMVHRVYWGKPCFLRINKMQYINKRAQATHQAARAAKEGRISILTDQHKKAVLDQSSRIPKSFTEKGLYKVPAKGTAEWEGLPSPDLWDAICFAFLEDVEYVPSGTGAESGQQTHQERARAAAASKAAAVFGD